jgi:hypothetical protein
MNGNELDDEPKKLLDHRARNISTLPHLQITNLHHFVLCLPSLHCVLKLDRQDTNPVEH